MKIFITGGTGFVGRYLVQELSRRGHHTKLLVHKKKSVTDSLSEQIEGDITRPETFVHAVTGCDAVIHLVGIIREFPSRGITFELLHVQATANILAAAKTAGVRRYLHMSALGTRENAVSGYHKTKFRAEELVRDCGLECTIMRPSLIYGAGDAFISMLAKQLRLAPVIPVIGNGEYRLQPIHAGDIATCFALALDKPETVGKSYELCGNERFSYNDLLDVVAEAIGRSSVKKLHLPLALMKMIIPTMQRVPQFPVTMDQLQMLLEENICDCSWKNTFAITARNFREAIREYL